MAESTAADAKVLLGRRSDTKVKQQSLKGSDVPVARPVCNDLLSGPQSALPVFAPFRFDSFLPLIICNCRVCRFGPVIQVLAALFRSLPV
jgi:hypothetical protein